MIQQSEIKTEKALLEHLRKTSKPTNRFGQPVHRYLDAMIKVLDENTPTDVIHATLSGSELFFSYRTKLWMDANSDERPSEMARSMV